MGGPLSPEYVQLLKNINIYQKITPNTQSFNHIAGGITFIGVCSGPGIFFHKIFLYTPDIKKLENF
jgi:hypothetical protein